MRTLPRFIAALLTALLAGTAFTAAGYQADDDRAPMQDLVIPAGELSADIEKGTTIIGGELAPELSAGSSFTSQVIESPIPFNAVVPQWTGTNPEAITLQVRTGPDGEAWGDWVGVHANHDWMEPGEAEIVGEMVLVPDAGITHRFVQVQVLFGAEVLPEGEPLEAPTLSQLRLTFIDTTQGPSADELIDLQSELDKDEPLLPDSLTAFPKPFVVSRAAWCKHADCNYTQGLEYHPVSHLIIHHTVSNNNSTDWPAVVRAIWNFHTYSRGWGDIGYNYLVDPNGVIYEGHNGGDDVIGTHASGANKGSMAVALLGTFTAYSPGIRPPQAMLNSAADLLAWKADQRDINVFDASRLPNLTWGLPHLMGHRDVYGTTECPGDQAHLLIPWFREQIASRIGFVDPFLYADEQSTAFTRSTTGTWNVPPYLCGFNNHAWYAWSVNSQAQSANWGEWRPNVPADGRYRIDVYVPYCRTGRNETGSATYTIRHAGGTSTRTVNQQANVGLWTTLGEYTLSRGNGNVIRLTNLTNDSGLGVWFDAVRLLPVDAPPPPPPAPVPANLDPANNVWKNNRAVTFTWKVANPETVTVTTLQVAADPSFANLVLVNQSWYGTPTTHTHTFTADFANLYWRVLVWRDNAPLISSAPTRFALDATAPQSAVATPLLFLSSAGRYLVSWAGDDGLSGLVRYQIDFRPAGGAWTRWLTDTTLQSAAFTPPVRNGTYEFRSVAVDLAGNVENVSGSADASTTDALQLNKSVFPPIIAR
ncbi:MAG: N-acetylmuramoyl-L-alanine amidase [Anaerolineae bacterium]|nr:N-acetylmuramoyl-L-alanine amidase [Anaerolineae bacterium]